MNNSYWKNDTELKEARLLQFNTEGYRTTSEDDQKLEWTKMHPEDLVWVAGTYASRPSDFPDVQKSKAWVYMHLRPLGIQPPEDLVRVRRMECSDDIRAGVLFEYLRSHKLPAVWYGGPPRASKALGATGLGNFKTFG